MTAIRILTRKRIYWFTMAPVQTSLSNFSLICKNNHQIQKVFVILNCFILFYINNYLIVIKFKIMVEGFGTNISGCINI